MIEGNSHIIVLPVLRHRDVRGNQQEPSGHQDPLARSEDMTMLSGTETSSPSRALYATLPGQLRKSEAL